MLADEFNGIAATPVTGPGTVLAALYRTDGWICVTVGVMGVPFAAAAFGVVAEAVGVTRFTFDCGAAPATVGAITEGKLDSARPHSRTSALT